MEAVGASMGAMETFSTSMENCKGFHEKKQQCRRPGLQYLRLLSEHLYLAVMHPDRGRTDLVLDYDSVLVTVI